MGESCEHARADGVTLTVSTPADDDRLAVHGDADELTRAVTNLVGNAIRHTGLGGTVKVAVDRGERRPGAARCDGRLWGHPGWTTWSGCSTSAGVATAADAGARLRTGGGLGLAIARGVVESHEGRIAVENVEGGCAFEIDLPAVG